MNFTFHTFRMVALCAALCLFGTLSAQNRNSLCQTIKGWGQCKNVAITERNGNAAIYGLNGYTAERVPVGMDNALKNLHAKGSEIRDLNLTDKGGWIVVADRNTVIGENLPSDMVSRINEVCRQNEKVLSVSFNSKNDWVIVTDHNVWASNEAIGKWVSDGMKQSGWVESVCIAENALVAVYQRGYSLQGNYPKGLENALRQSGIQASTVKVCGNCWFIADKNGNYSLSM